MIIINYICEKCEHPKFYIFKIDNKFHIMCEKCGFIGVIEDLKTMAKV